MNPLSQLFGILVEKMPGYVAPVKWEKDKLIAQREMIASKLLFSKALQANTISATRNFVSKIGGTTTERLKRVSIPSPSPFPSPAVKTITKQSSLDAFIRDTAVGDDERLARAMRASKKSK